MREIIVEGYVDCPLRNQDEFRGGECNVDDTECDPDSQAEIPEWCPLRCQAVLVRLPRKGELD